MVEVKTETLPFGRVEPRVERFTGSAGNSSFCSAVDEAAASDSLLRTFTGDRSRTPAENIDNLIRSPKLQS